MRRTVFLLTLIAAPLAAQTQHGSANAAVSVVRTGWLQAHNYILRSAEQLPESLYNYKPTPVVRSFGELFGHVAGAEMLFCAEAMGEKAPAEDAVEKSAKTKAALIAALKRSGTYCEKAYAMTDAASSGAAAPFGMKMTKLGALGMNATHDWEHYGNLVTYLRLKGMTPPSSQ